MSEEFRQMPHNLDAERAVLGSVLLENKCLPEITEILREDDFYDPAHRAIYSTFEKLDTASKPIDPTMVREQLETDGMLDVARGPTYIMQLESAVMSIRNVVDHCKVVKNKATHRASIQIAHKMEMNAYDDGIDINTTMSDAQSEIMDLQKEESRENIIHISEPVMTVMDRVDELRASKSNISGIATGLDKFDDNTGGLQPGDLFVLAARTSVGKTALALTITYHMSVINRKLGLWFSAEMNDTQLAQRLISIGSQIERGKDDTFIGLQQIRNPYHLPESEMWKLNAYAKRVGSAPIHIDDTPCIDISDLRSRAKYFKQAHHDLAYCVVDYVQLMGASNNDNEVAKITEITQRLKQLGRECEIPIIALAQVNRGGVDKPELYHLKGSSSIEQDADIVFMMHRHDDVDRALEYQPIDGFLAKIRNGQPMEMNMSFHGPTTTFSEI